MSTNTTSKNGKRSRIRALFEHFPEPRSWALKWDGVALSARDARTDPKTGKPSRV